MKIKVKNKARVEGSIAERYTEEELVNFCSLYFEEEVSTKHNRLGRNGVAMQEGNNALSIFTYSARPYGCESNKTLTDIELNIISIYVLFNCPEVSS